MRSHIQEGTTIYESAYCSLKEHKEQLIRLAELLFEKETIVKEDIDTLLAVSKYPAVQAGEV